MLTRVAYGLPTYVLNRRRANVSKEIIDVVKARKGAYIIALDDARNDKPINDDEHYESDEFYETAITVLDDLIKELENEVR